MRNSMVNFILIGVTILILVMGPLFGSISVPVSGTDGNNRSYSGLDTELPLYYWDLNNNKIEDLLEVEISARDEDEEVEVIVTLRDKVDEKTLDYFTNLGANIITTYHVIEVVTISISIGKLISLTKCTRVEMVNSNPKIIPALASAVPVINADPTSLSAAGYGDIDGSGVTIAVIDSGIDGSHSTFPSWKIIAFKDIGCGQDDLDPTDGMNAVDYGVDVGIGQRIYHGTMCASCVAGTGGGTSDRGTALGAYLIGINIFDGTGTTDLNDLLQAIQWCIDNKNLDFNKDGTPDGPDIISMSLGPVEHNSVLESACAVAIDAGIVFVTAAGNSGPGSNTIMSPSCDPRVISVGAIDDNKNIWVSSSRGPGDGGCIKPDVCAPGVSVTSAYPPNTWVTTSGTSLACPIVAGICALLLQLDPTLTHADIQDILHDTAEDRGSSGPDNDYGWGVVDAVAALDGILNIQEIITPYDYYDEDEEITFSATVSGQIVLYEWDFDGDGDYDWESTTTPEVTHSYTKAGNYQAELKITDSNELTESASIEITVNNTLPEAKAVISGESVEEDEEVEFYGGDSWDTPSDYKILNYSWDFGDGFSSEWIESPSITHSYSNEGSYVVTLMVKDDDGETDEDRITIEVSNVLPMANAGCNKIVNEDEKVSFNGNQSYDSPSDKAILNYTWEFGDGAMGFGMIPIYSYSSQGTYIVTLTIRDDNNAISKSTITVRVYNVRPSVIAAEEDIVAEEDENIDFCGIGWDTPSDFVKLEYRWDFGDDTSSGWIDTPNTTHAYTNSGVYSAKLEVRDDNDEVNFTTIEVKINNVPPTCEVSYDQTNVNEDDLITFTCIDSWDTDSDIDYLEYLWDFGDGNTEEGKSVTHSFEKKGTYEVSLTVIDDDDDQGISTLEVLVSNLAPIADATYRSPHDPVREKEIIVFDGSGTWDTVSDLPLLSYHWDFGDDESGDGQITEHTYENKGEYEVTLIVKDDDGAIFATTILVNVCENKTQPGGGSDMEYWGVAVQLGLSLTVIIILAMIVFFARSGKKSKAKLAHAKSRAEKDQRFYQLPQPPSQPQIGVHENLVPSFQTLPPSPPPSPLLRQQPPGSLEQPSPQPTLANPQQPKSITPPPLEPPSGETKTASVHEQPEEQLPPTQVGVTPQEGVPPPTIPPEPETIYCRYCLYPIQPGWFICPNCSNPLGP